MFTGIITKTVSVAGVDFTSRVTKTSDGVSAVNGEIIAAKNGTLTTRTDADTGVVTVVGHGIQLGDKVDIYWSAGGVMYKQELCEATAVNGNDVTFDNGSGTSLPNQGTAVFVCKVSSFAFSVNSLPAMLAVFVAKAATVRLMEVDTLRMTLNLGAEEAYAWSAGGYEQAPLAGSPVTRISASTPETGGNVLILATTMIDA